MIRAWGVHSGSLDTEEPGNLITTFSEQLEDSEKDGTSDSRETEAWKRPGAAAMGQHWEDEGAGV